MIICPVVILGLSHEFRRTTGLDAEAKLALFSPGLRTICRGQFDGVLDSKSGLKMGDFAYRRHELEVWRAFFRIDPPTSWQGFALWSDRECHCEERSCLSVLRTLGEARW